MDTISRNADSGLLLYRVGRIAPECRQLVNDEAGNWQEFEISPEDERCIFPGTQYLFGDIQEANRQIMAGVSDR